MMPHFRKNFHYFIASLPQTRTQQDPNKAPEDVQAKLWNNYAKFQNLSEI